MYVSHSDWIQHEIEEVIYLKQQLALCCYKDNEVNYKKQWQG